MLQLVKTDPCLKTTAWQHSQTLGQNLLRDMSGGDEDELKLILGDNYEPHTTLLRGSLHAPPNSPSAGGTSSKRPAPDSDTGDAGMLSKRLKADSIHSA